MRQCLSSISEKATAISNALKCGFLVNQLPHSGPKLFKCFVQGRCHLSKITFSNLEYMKQVISGHDGVSQLHATTALTARKNPITYWTPGWPQNGSCDGKYLLIPGLEPRASSPQPPSRFIDHAVPADGIYRA